MASVYSGTSMHVTNLYITKSSVQWMIVFTLVIVKYMEKNLDNKTSL